MQQWGTLTKPLLLWKSNKYYILLCVGVRACAFVGVGAQALACACKKCSLTDLACNAPEYCHLRLSGSTTFFDTILQTARFKTFETFLVPRRIQKDIVLMWKRLHVKYPLLVSDFNKTWIFSTDFLKKKAQTSKFHQNPSSGSRVRCGWTNGQTKERTGMTKLIVAFHNFANAL